MLNKINLEWYMLVNNNKFVDSMKSRIRVKYVISKKKKINF
jgi:hypothetical protein